MQVVRPRKGLTEAMSDRGHGVSRQIVADFCAILPLLEEELPSPTAGAAVRSVIQSIKRDRDVHSRLIALVRQLNPQYGMNESASDAIAELVLLTGIPYAPGVRTRSLPGRVAGHAIAQNFRCPADRCDRSWLRKPGAPIPLCSLYSKPLLEQG
jgi:hypothetical protein